MINLKVTDIDFDALRPLLALVEDVAQSSGNQSPIVVAACSSGHRKSLTTSGLPVGENCAIESFQGRIDDIFRYFVKDFLLLCVHIEDLVELEGPLLLFVIDVSLVLVFLNEELRPIFLLVYRCIME